MTDPSRTKDPSVSQLQQEVTAEEKKKREDLKVFMEERAAYTLALRGELRSEILRWKEERLAACTENAARLREDLMCAVGGRKHGLDEDGLMDPDVLSLQLQAK